MKKLTAPRKIVLGMVDIEAVACLMRSDLRICALKYIRAVSGATLEQAKSSLEAVMALPMAKPENKI